MRRGLDPRVYQPGSRNSVTRDISGFYLRHETLSSAPSFGSRCCVFWRNDESVGIRNFVSKFSLFPS